MSSVRIYGTKLLKVTDKTKSPVTVDDATDIIDASSRTKAIKITGDEFDNTIIGGSGNDKLYGGAGNDCIVGGKGNDTFIYSTGDGKDVICGFANDDLLKSMGTFSGTYNKSNSEVYFKVGSTAKAITLHDFTATSFNINGTKLVRS